MMDHIEIQSELAVDLEVYMIIFLEISKCLYMYYFSIILIDHIKVLHV
jgi:hypothetical protein